jgi:hypothetical protein
MDDVSISVFCGPLRSKKLSFADDESNLNTSLSSIVWSYSTRMKRIVGGVRRKIMHHQKGMRQQTTTATHAHGQCTTRVLSLDI